MRKAITSTATLRPSARREVIAALGALPRNPRTMLALRRVARVGDAAAARGAGS